MKSDPLLDFLLDLDGVTLPQEGGYWIAVEARLVAPSAAVPHGIHYSLTFHNPYGKRVLGYDNAHAIRLPKKYKYAGSVRTNDHKHRHPADRGVPYEFKDIQQLLNDFFADVSRALQEVAQ